MIMSLENLSPLEERIIEAMGQADGEWLSRNQIAALIGRKDGYTQNDARALNSLLERGLIEARETLIGVAKKMFEYRLKGD